MAIFAKVLQGFYRNLTTIKLWSKDVWLTQTICHWKGFETSFDLAGSTLNDSAWTKKTHENMKNGILNQNVSLVPHTHARSFPNLKPKVSKLVPLEIWCYKLSNDSTFEQPRGGEVQEQSPQKLKKKNVWNPQKIAQK